jgi:hypothetical protein
VPPGTRTLHASRPCTRLLRPKAERVRGPATPGGEDTGARRRRRSRDPPRRSHSGMTHAARRACCGPRAANADTLRALARAEATASGRRGSSDRAVRSVPPPATRAKPEPARTGRARRSHSRGNLSRRSGGSGRFPTRLLARDRITQRLDRVLPFWLSDLHLRPRTHDRRAAHSEHRPDGMKTTGASRTTVGR